MKTTIRDFFVASLSGALTALAFPKFNFSFLAWVSLIPLLFVLLNKKPGRSFLLGLAAGFFHYAILIYWIPFVPTYYGNLPVATSLAIYIFFALILSLIWAFFSLSYAKISRSFPVLVFFIAPLLWVSLEYILTYIFTGFPWCLLGYSQFKNIPFIQLASVAGVYGLSFILVLFQSIFVCSMRTRRKLPFFAALALILFIHGAGFLSIKKIPGSDTRTQFTAAVIQGNVPSDTYWGSLTAQETSDLFNQHLELSKKAHEDGAEFVIWPELTVPLCFSCPEEYYVRFKQGLFDFVRETKTALLLGTIETTGGEGKTLYHNAALCLSPDFLVSQYFKMHLVPFGEYIPYKQVFFFLEKMTTAIGDLTPGSQPVLHSFKNYRFGSPICYEIIFPGLVRKFVKMGANFLVTITNDGWYRRSSAPYQHFSMAVLRAVENRRFLLRAATTGISGIIDPYGRVLSKSELLTQTYLVGRIRPLSNRTLYTRYGDFLPLASLTLSLFFLALSMIRRKRERKPYA